MLCTSVYAAYYNTLHIISNTIQRSSLSSFGIFMFMFSLAHKLIFINLILLLIPSISFLWITFNIYDSISTRRDTRNRIDFITLNSIAIENNLSYYLHVSVRIIKYNYLLSPYDVSICMHLHILEASPSMQPRIHFRSASTIRQ